nr:MAG TPA: hypothetical protein [Caudoviricetes sp.]
MDAADLRKILREEYGIKNDEEFEMAVEASAGVNLGLFTQPFKGENDDKKTDNVDAA